MKPIIRLILHCPHLWETEGIQQDEVVRGVLLKEHFPWLAENLLTGKDIVIADVEEYSELEEFHKEYEYCKQLRIQSFIILPIQISNAPLCAIGLDSMRDKKTWSEEIISRLRTMGEVFANTIGRRHAEEELRTTYEEVKKLKDQLDAESKYLQEEIRLEHNFENIIGKSQALKYVLYRAEQVAKTNSSVLLLGETGTGKELIARAIHKLSSRRKRALVKVNCAALPRELVESELFGHEKGAFTGAAKKQIGRFEFADRSILFLDEIGEMPYELQAKLLRVLESGEYERLGNPKTLHSDARVIASTNRNLEEEVRKGNFREDLWYRLKVFPITLPPLRQRQEDIPMLVNWFVGQLSRKIGKQIAEIPKRTMQKLQNYPWPGNVRELKNAVESALITATGTKLHFELPEVTASSISDFMSLEEMERDYILQVLKAKNWKIQGANSAASVLQMHPNTLRARITKLGLKRPA
jgi:transcriptional regulator with GAF, ATPase, and Fis domain